MTGNQRSLDNLLREVFRKAGLADTDKFLLACSGGIDSVVLFHLLLKANIKFSVAHVNYKLRGIESDADEHFVAELCLNHNIPLYIKRLDTKLLTENTDESIQMFARRLRYEWFYELVKQYSYKAILTAHHADDNVETVLHNMMRGCGLTGIVGMQLHTHRILRPLLSINRHELLAYAQSKHIEWREDSSNAKTDYTRNQIRLEVIPEFEKMNPAFKKTFHENIIRWQDEHLLAEKLIKQFVQKLITRKLETEVVAISRLTSCISPKTALHYWLYPYGFNEDVIEDILDSIQSTHESKVFNSNSHRVIKTNRELILSAIESTSDHTFIIQPGTQTIETAYSLLRFEIIKNNSEINFKNTHYHYINADTISFPLLLRSSKRGDYFYPFGLNKKKKLSDYFNEKKLNQLEKEQTLVLTQDDKILCLCGLQIDHRFGVTRQTKKVLRIHVQKKSR